MKPAALIPSGLLAAVLLAAAAPQAVHAPVKRAALIPMERNFDAVVERLKVDDPYVLLGNTRGVYLGGFGAVFTAEVNLVNSPVISPFRQTISKEDVARVRVKKLQRLPLLKQAMQRMMKTMADGLGNMPDNEQVVLGVSLFYYSWEDTAGLPGQVVMRATRQQILANAAIPAEEF